MRELWSRFGLRTRFLATHLLVALLPAALFLSLVLILLSVLAPSTLAVAPLSSGQMLAILLIAAIAGLAGAGIALVVGTGLFRQVAGPVRRASAIAGRLSRGQYSEREQPPLPGEPGAPNQLSASSESPGELGGLVASLEELAESLRQAERRRTESFGEITHEIRTPVAILEGYLEGLLDGHVKPSDETWAMLHSEASRVHRLVDELQALSKYEARQAPPDLRSIDPGEIARAALERLRLHFKEKGLEVATDIPSDLPLVLADPDHTTQVLVNLLTNALRYTPAPGTVTLSVSRFMDEASAGGPAGTEARAGVGEVIFRVKDTGVGIAAEYIPHLFERFFRVDRSGSRSMVGHGLGLPVAKALVEAMGGKIWAESDGPGKGSTFSFTLLVSIGSSPC